jgi:predicted phage terminase large subunit-like protein
VTKIPASLQAAALLELRKRRVSKKDQLHDDEGNFVGMQRYCEIVTPSWNWKWPHLMKLDEVLDKVISGEIKRLIVSMPTRIGKTEKVNVRFAAAYLELFPSAPLLLGGYNERFAMRLSRKIQRIVEERVPLSNRRSVSDWETAEGGGIRAVGVGVGVAGLPAKGVLIDDPTKNKEDAYSQAHRDKVWDWYTEDMYTRLEPDGFIVITMARRHEDDLVGRILASEDGPNWVEIRLPALAEEDDPLGRAPGEALCPDRFDEEAYAKMRMVMGEVAFSGLQQQRPTPDSGLIFQSDQIRFYTTPDHPIQEKDGSFVPVLPQVRWDEIFQSWDMSFKDKTASDPIAGHVWARKGVDAYFLDRMGGRRSFTKTIEEVRGMSRKWPKALLKLVEDKANGTAVISTLKSELGGFKPIDPEGDKVSRAWSVTPLFEGGNVWFPHPKIAPWVPKVITQMTQFPFGANDDDVDALTQALRKIMKTIERLQKHKEFAKRRARTRSMVVLKM